MKPDETLPLMRRVSVVMFLVGGITCASGVLTTQSTPASRLAQGCFAGAFLACALVLFAAPARKWLVQATDLLSILLLSGLMATSNPIGMGPFFYLWPVVFAAYFGSARMLGAALSTMVLTLPIGLALNETHRLKLDTFIGTIATVGTMAALVTYMSRRQARLSDELAHAADTDPLTGVLNRRAFNPGFAGLVARANAGERPLSVVMFDLDHFKRFNDEHGHLAGDEALQRMADVLRAHARADDLVARLGGEEFAVVLPGADAAAARAYVDRVVAALADDERAVLRISTSAGIASRAPGAHVAELLLARADAALYAAKQAGRARTAWWDGALVVA